MSVGVVFVDVDGEGYFGYAYSDPDKQIQKDLNFDRSRQFGHSRQFLQIWQHLGKIENCEQNCADSYEAEDFGGGFHSVSPMGDY